SRSFLDVECCQVFSDDFTDDSATCLTTCTKALRSPSLRTIDKLKSIKSCRSDNKNYTCFRRCQSFLRSRTTQSEKFPYLAVCDLASRLQPNVLYIGPALKD
ncbi:Her-1, partial [Ostertagia ostertagi]